MLGQQVQPHHREEDANGGPARLRLLRPPRVHHMLVDERRIAQRQRVRHHGVVRRLGVW
jgi:hypothetical protein